MCPTGGDEDDSDLERVLLFLPPRNDALSYGEEDGDLERALLFLPCGEEDKEAVSEDT